MGLFSKKQDYDLLKNAVQVNEIDPASVIKPFPIMWGKKGRFDYARMLHYIILQKLFNGVKNVNFKTTKTDYLAFDITTFIDSNSQTLLYHYWKNGFCCLICEKSGYVRLPYQNELKFDANGRVTNKSAVVIYSDLYVTSRTTHFQLALPFINSINDSLNNENFVGNQQGLMGILSGKGIPMSPAAKEDLQQKLKKNYGWNQDQYQFILSNTEMDWTPIEIPVDKLQFDEKTAKDFKWLCSFYGINPDFLFGGSTFNNQDDATVNFYRTAIAPLAEILLKLARAAFIFMSTDLEPSSIITYDFSNVAELKSNLSSKCDERSKYLDYLMKLQEAGVDVSDEITKLGNELKTMLTDI